MLGCIESRRRNPYVLRMAVVQRLQSKLLVVNLVLFAWSKETSLENKSTSPARATITSWTSRKLSSKEKKGGPCFGLRGIVHPQRPNWAPLDSYTGGSQVCYTIEEEKPSLCPTSWTVLYILVQGSKLSRQRSMSPKTGSSVRMTTKSDDSLRENGCPSQSHFIVLLMGQRQRSWLEGNLRNQPKGEGIEE